VQAIPARFRCKLADYKDSRLDRGHMAPAMNHKFTQKGMDDTFFLTNICPQARAMHQLQVHQSFRALSNVETCSSLFV
jgi:DNA/RNA endonuclease G (NUC1)